VKATGQEALAGSSQARCGSSHGGGRPPLKQEVRLPCIMLHAAPYKSLTRRGVGSARRWQCQAAQRRQVVQRARENGRMSIAA